MALYSTSTHSGAPPISSGVAFDFNTAFVSTPNNYSTAMMLQQAIKMPLGSEFNLLPSENITSQLSGKSIPQVATSSLDRVMQGYNTTTIQPHEAYVYYRPYYDGEYGRTYGQAY